MPRYRCFGAFALTLLLAGCTSTAPPENTTHHRPEEVSVPGTAAGIGPTPLPSTIGVPVWKRAYDWSYRYDSTAGKGTYVWSVDREEVVDGMECYVIKAGTREIFYRKSDVAYVRETVDGVLVIRAVPPRVHYLWPLIVGQTWDQSFHEERPQDRQTQDIARTVSVDAEEPVTVPAGTFQTLKITARNTRSGALAYEMWYAPAVMQWVRLREHLASGLREREMTGYKLGETGPSLAQTRVASAVAACNQELGTNIRMGRVSEDGRTFEVRYDNTGTAESERFRRCLRDRFGFRFPGDPGYSGWGSGSR